MHFLFERIISTNVGYQFTLLLCKPPVILGSWNAAWASCAKAKRV